MECPPWERSVQDRALQNPVILTEILKRAGLKDCRLVCHFWNDTVLSLPNTRLALNLSRKDEDGDSDTEDAAEAMQFLELCFALDDRLAKRITIDTPSNVSYVYRLMHVCDNFYDQVQVLELSVRDEDFLNCIYRILKIFCPNLKQLRIDANLVSLVDRPAFAPGKGPILPVKPNLTFFALTGYSFHLKVKFLTTLANFIQMVVDASPNLRKLTIPWGFYPDLGNSKGLESLNISLKNVDPVDVADAQNVPKLSGMLHQVDDQLVSLCFGIAQNPAQLVPSDNYDLEYSSQIGLRFSRRMPKLRRFSNRIVDMFRCADFLQNIEMMPFLETLVIGRALSSLESVDEVLRGICTEKKIFPSVRKLVLIQLDDPNLLDGVGTAFPNVERFEVGKEFTGDEDRIEVGVVLEACRDWKGLKHLKVTLSEYPELVDFFKTLLQGRELFQRLRTLDIDTFDGYSDDAELTEVEMDLLLVMDGMDRVTFNYISLSKESVANVLTFMVSNNLDVGKFRLQNGSPFHRAGD